MERIVEEQDFNHVVSAAVPKVVKRRRPNLPDIDLDKPLSTKFLFALKSLDSGAIITKVAIDGDSLVVGT